jgi:hypothetical protein
MITFNDEALNEIISGISKTEFEGGWWETSSGADFGSKVENDLLNLFNSYREHFNLLLSSIEYYKSNPPPKDVELPALPELCDESWDNGYYSAIKDVEKALVEQGFIISNPLLDWESEFVEYAD